MSGVAVVLRRKTHGGVRCVPSACWYGTFARDGTRRELRSVGRHYARTEAMTWCENNGIDYIFGLYGTKFIAEK